MATVNSYGLAGDECCQWAGKKKHRRFIDAGNRHRAPAVLKPARARRPQTTGLANQDRMAAEERVREAIPAYFITLQCALSIKT